MKFLVVLFFVLFVDLVMAQQTVDKIKVNNLNLPSESASSALLINGSKQVKASASVSSTELEYLDGVSSAIQTQLNAKAADSAVMKLTTDQSASGVKTFTGKTVASSTTNGFRPCPVMTQTQRDATSPSSGDCVYNSTSNKWNIYNGTAWKEAGGGAGGTRLQLMSDPSFEDGVTEGTCTGCTAMSETSVVLVTPTNEKSGKAAFSASAGDYKVTKSTSAQFSSAQGYVRCQIKTNQSGVEFKAYVDGVNNDNAQDTTAVIGDSVWRPYEIAIVHGSTSAGWAIDTDSAITGDVYFDECAVVVGEIGLEVAQEQLAQSAYIQNANCAPTTTSASFVDFGADTDCGAPVSILSRVGSLQLTDADAISFTVNSLPPGDYIAVIDTPLTTSVSANAGLRVTDGTNSGQPIGINNQAGGVITPSSAFVSFTQTSSGNKTFKIQGKTSAGTFTATGTDPYTAHFRLYYYPPASKIYSQACNDPRVCGNVFSAEVGATGTVTSENLDWISGNCTNAVTRVCTLNSFGLTTGMNCTASSTAGSEVIATVSASSSSSISVATFVSGSGSAQAFKIICQKASPDFTTQNQITGTFANVVTAPGISKPKTCYYAFGQSGATLASPTECTSGTCGEVYDSCGTGTPPTWATTAIYNDMTFAAGTWANSTFLKCDCVAYDVTTGTVKECTHFFVTSDQTWSTTSSGGAVLNTITYDNGGAQSTGYVSIECTGQAP